MKINDGRDFEAAVYDWVEAGVQDGSLGLLPQNTKVDAQYPLYSRDRDSTIIFDVVVRVFRASASDPFLVWIWECKDYSHKVPVSDVEEFDSKLAQVGRNRTKGTMISTAGFQKGAISLAKSSGIGLIRASRGEEGIVSASVAAEAVASPRSDFVTNALLFAVSPWAFFQSRGKSRSSTGVAKSPEEELIRSLSGESSVSARNVFLDSEGRLMRCDNHRELLKAAFREVSE